jgi:hypothetical protein
MSHESTEQFIRRMYERWNAEGINAMAEDFFDPDVEYHDDTVWPGGGTHIGRPAVVARFEEAVTTLGLKQAFRAYYSAEDALKAVGLAE